MCEQSYVDLIWADASLFLFFLSYSILSLSLFV